MASTSFGSSGSKPQSDAALLWLSAASGFHSVTAAQRSRYVGFAVEYTDGRIRWSFPDCRARLMELRPTPCASNCFLVTRPMRELWRLEVRSAVVETFLWINDVPVDGCGREKC